LSFSGRRNDLPGPSLLLTNARGEGTMKIIGAALLVLSLASGGMAVTTILATAHPTAVGR
jgi:hypothetical protein